MIDSLQGTLYAPCLTWVGGEAHRSDLATHSDGLAEGEDREQRCQRDFTVHGECSYKGWLAKNLNRFLIVTSAKLIGAFNKARALVGDFSGHCLISRDPIDSSTEISEPLISLQPKHFSSLLESRSSLLQPSAREQEKLL